MTTDTAPVTSCKIQIGGMDCADCARTIEASVAQLPGVRSANVSFGLARLDAEYDPGAIGEAEITRRIAALGYTATPPVSGSKDAWVFDLTGMDCGDCAKTIEAGVRRLPHVQQADVSFGAATLTVTPAGDRLSRGAVLAAVSEAGYRATPRDATEPVAHARRWWTSRRVLETTTAALLWLTGFTLEHAGASMWIAAVPFLAAMALAGYPVARAAWFAVKARRPDMNLLMTIAAVGAIAIGEWDEGASVLILFAIGLTLQSLTLDRTRRAIQSLLRLAPREATVRRDGRDERLPIEAVSPGDLVIVRPGERIPVDGEVESGQSVADQSSITGESVPVAVTPGSSVFAASINGDGELAVRSSRTANDSTFAKIVQMVESAQGSRAPAQAFVDRFAAIYTPIVVGIAFAIATLVPLVAGEWQTWIFRALVLLVVACPCALVISTPVAMVAAIGSASRRGVLFKGGAAIEALASVRTVALDKTGTLTAGRPAVVRVVPFDGISSERLLALSAAVERRSSHPIASGIVEAARQREIAVPDVTDARAIPGQGAQGTVDGQVVTAGSLRLFPNLSEVHRKMLRDLEAEGLTVVIAGIADEPMGVIALSDPIRPASADTIARLRDMGLTTAMLTGDNAETAARIGRVAGIDEIRAGLLPADKVAAIQELQGTGPVAMIGDGVNDAPALAIAEVGIAMGVAGTDVAIEAADVTLMADDIAQVPVAIDLARRTLAIVRQNIGLSLLAKLLFLGLTVAGITNLWLAVLADMGMSLLVTFNSLRLARAATNAETRAKH